MKYCDKCKRLQDSEQCALCRGKSTRLPKADDECLLTECEMLFGEMLSEALRDRQIPFYFKALRGAGLTMRIGPYCDVYRFYVPFSHWEEACDVAAVICPNFEE